MAGLALIFMNGATAPSVLSFGSAVHEPVAGSFGMYREVEDPIEIELLDPGAPYTVITDLPLSRARSFRDVPSGVGSGTLSVQYDDPDVAQLSGERMIRWKINGRPATQTLIETVVRRTINSDEEAGQTVVASGRNIVAILEEAVVYPTRGPATLPIEDTRTFNFANYDFDDSGWGQSAMLGYQGSETRYWTGLPARWPTPSAGWIWAPGMTHADAASGVCFFRHRFVIPVGVTQIAIHFSLDDNGELWFDGQRVMEHIAYSEYKTVVIPVTPGEHLIAVKARNNPPWPESFTETTTTFLDAFHTVVSGDTLWAIARRYYGDPTKWPAIYSANQAQIQADATAAGLWNPRDPGHWIFPGQIFTIPGAGNVAAGTTHRGNPGGVLVSVHETTIFGLGQLLTASNGSWRCLPYPDQEPGMTPGEVLGILLDEAQHRRCFPELVRTFNAFVDSAGNAWPRVGDIAVRVGDDYLTVLNQLAETYIDFAMAPAGLVLDAFDIDAAGMVMTTYTPGVDLTELTHERDV